MARALRILVQGPDIRRSSHGGVVTLVKTLLDSRLKQEYQMKWDFLEVRGKTWIQAIYFFLRDLCRVHRNLKRNHYDLVHAHVSIAPTAFVKLFFYVLEKRLRGFRLVVHFHGGRFAAIRKWFPLFQVALNRADRILFVSDVQADEFKSRHLGNQIEVVPNFIPDFAPTLDQREPNRMVFVGRIVEEKGVFDLIRAVDRLTCDEFQLHVCGDGPALSQAIELVEQLGLQKHIVFEGYVGQDQKRELMSRCSILVLPSWSEGFPFAILEAMSYGLAIVTTKVGALGDVLRDGINGRFVECRNPQHLSHVLGEVLEDSLLQRQYGDHNRNEFVSRYVMDPVGVETFSRIYDSTCTTGVDSLKK